MTPGKVVVFGVPSAAGASRSGVERAPHALREAGLLTCLRQLGRSVVNLSDLSLFPFRADDGQPRARNLQSVACAVRAAADEMTRALAQGFTLVLGGDCTVVAGTLAGANQALGRPVGLVYIDANADLNTPDTTPSGMLNGMAVSLAIGRGPAAIPSGRTLAEHVALVGFRELDPGERHTLGLLGLALSTAAAQRLGMRASALLALDAITNADGPVLVHLDVDVIDPASMPAKTTVTPGPGLSLDEVRELLTTLLASPRVVALEVVEFDPSLDPDGACARRLVDLIGSVLRVAGGLQRTSRVMLAPPWTR